MRVLIKQYLKNTTGHFAVTFALMGIPLVVATTFVVDYSSASTEKVNIKTSLDAAVIAAVNNNSLSLSAKEGYAKTHFIENYKGPISVKLEPKATGDRVEMSAQGLSPVTVAGTLGIDGIKVFERSAAEFASENVICVMSLAPDMKEAITFEDGVTFRAPTCSVHANSIHEEAIVSSGLTAPSAKSFCAAGGVTGDFLPYAKGECSVINDPYEHLRMPMPSPCISGTSLDGKSKGSGFTVDEGTDINVMTTVESDNVTGDNVILYPGTYCGGLTVDGANVTFRSGEYIMLEGPLTFKNTAIAKAYDVSFILQGEKTKLKIEKGADVYVKAPSQGELEGIAFVQVPYIELGKEPRREKSEIKSGGKLEILGTLYFPENTLKISGHESSIGAQAPATSFIAFDIHFGKGDIDDNGFVTVAVDHHAAGLPPILPRIEDGARLVQ